MREVLESGNPRGGWAPPEPTLVLRATEASPDDGKPPDLLTRGFSLPRILSTVRARNSRAVGSREPVAQGFNASVCKSLKPQKYRMCKNNTNCIFKEFHAKRESPHGNLNQDKYRERAGAVASLDLETPSERSKPQSPARVSGLRPQGLAADVMGRAYVMEAAESRGSVAGSATLGGRAGREKTIILRGSAKTVADCYVNAEASSASSFSDGSQHAPTSTCTEE